MAENKLTIKLTGDQQKQILDAAGQSVTELCMDLNRFLSEKDLDKVAGGASDTFIRTSEK